MLVAEGQNDPTLADFTAAYPCVTFNVEQVPFPELGRKIQVLAASQALPDILYYDGPNTQTYAYNQLLLALDSYITPEHKADIVDSTILEHTYQDKLYSPGLRQSAVALFYNKTMTDAAGIEPPKTLEDAWTWEQALEAFKAVQQGPADNPTVWGLAPSVFGDGTPGSYYRDGIMMRSMGDPTASPDSSAYKTFVGIAPDLSTVSGYVNSPEAVAGLEFYQGLLNDSKVSPKAGEFGMWINGKAAFDLIDPFMIFDIKAKGDDMFDWGMTPVPAFTTPITHTGSDAIGVSATTEHPDLAAAVVMFASSPSNQQKFYETAGAMGVLKSVLANTPDYQEWPQKIFVDELVEWGQPRPPSPVFAQYDDIMTRAIHDVALGTDVQTRMDKAAEEMNDVLSRFEP